MEEFSLDKNQITLIEKVFENEAFNKNSKKNMLDNSKAEVWAKAIVHFIFRNGPVEDIHSKGNLTDEDMKVINKHMLDQMTGLVLSMQKGEWFILEQMAQIYLIYGAQWDPADLTHYINEKEITIKRISNLLLEQPDLVKRIEKLNSENRRG
jgi:hypothetical protein